MFRYMYSTCRAKIIRSGIRILVSGALLLLSSGNLGQPLPFSELVLFSVSEEGRTNDLNFHSVLYCMMLLFRPPRNLKNDLKPS